MNALSEEALAQARSLISASQRPVVFTGAGVSQESGIPTFRDALEGLWAQYNPEDLATPEAFERDPELVWNFYQHRRETLQHCRPNLAHYALAELEQARPACVLITQNVDGFHQLAGSRHVIPLHGNIRENRCYFDCSGLIRNEDLPQEGPIPPLCPQCGERSLRPNVVWFGEHLDEAHMDAARKAVEACDLFLIVGTSGSVQPAASLAMQAIARNKVVIEVNPEATVYSQAATVSLRAPAATTLSLIVPGSGQPS